MPDSGAPHQTTFPLRKRLEDLRRIAELSDPILRNLLITQRYHDLSMDLAAVLGPSSANWSTFATWASKTAGRSIREEQVPAEFTGLLHERTQLEARLEHFYRKLGPLARFAPSLAPFELAHAIIREVARQIAEGNLRVYRELAPLFAEFAAAFADSTGRTQPALDLFLGKLKPGAAENDGQDLLKEAFQNYFRASISPNQVERIELILFGNLLIGLHEQTRLQENIAGALNAPFSEKIYQRFGAAGPKFLHGFLRKLLKIGVRFFASELLDDWQRLATRFLMILLAPNGDEIRLGEELPPEEFDKLLVQLKNPDLVEFMSRFDPDLSSTRGSEAVNWTVLADRMRFIGELFRVSQRDPSWFQEPFQVQQRTDIEAGRVPAGQL